MPRSKNRIKFEIEGPGEIVAVDNGDATSHESFQSKEYNVFNGLCLVIVRTKAYQSGNIRLTAQSEGLEAHSAGISVNSGSCRNSAPAICRARQVISETF